MAGFTNSVPPTISGNRVVGGTLTAAPGTWAPTPNGFQYQWERADDAAGTNRAQITGATSGTYVLTAEDTTKVLRVGVYPNDPVSSAIPGPVGVMLFTWSAENETLGSPAPAGALAPPWDARRDVSTIGQFNPDGSGEMGVWSIVSKNGMKLLQADLPLTNTRPTHRVDLVEVATTNMNPGLEHWYAIEFMLPTGWTAPNTTWGLLIAQWIELGSAKIAPLSEIDILQDRANFAIQVGSTTSVEAQYSPRFPIVPVGQLSLEPTMHQIILRMNFQINDTGRYQAWWRRKGETTWTLTVDWTGPTMMYSAANGTYTKELRDEIDAYSAAGPALRMWHHKYARATGPGVLEAYLNS